MKTNFTLLIQLFFFFSLSFNATAQTIYGNVSAIAYDKTGKYLVTGGENGKANIWDVEKSEILREILFYKSSTVKAISISPDNKFMAIAVGGEGTTIYTFPEGKKIKGLKVGGSVNLAYAPDGNLVTINYEGVAEVCDVANDKVLKEFKFKKITYCPLAISPDGKYLLTAAPNDNIKLWDMTGDGKSEIFKDKIGSTPRSVAFSPDSKFFAVTGNSGDNATVIYNTETKAIVKAFSNSYGDNSIIFSPDNKSVFLTNSNSIKIIDITSGETKGTLSGHNKNVRCMTMSADGKFLISGSDDASVITWDLLRASSVKTVLHYNANDKAIVRQLGQKWGGGLVVHAYRTSDGKEHGLIMSLEDNFEVIWSEQTDKFVGVMGADGANNTEAIINSGGLATDAAGICRAYRGGDFSDWYLPSVAECQIITKNIGTTKWEDFYWTSSEADKGNAYVYQFNLGESGPKKKSKKGRMRPVRRF